MSAKLEVYRGTTYPVIYKHTDTSGTAVDLTGKTLYFTVKADKYDTSADDSTALIKKTITSHTGTIGNTTLNASTGTTGFYLTDTDTFLEPGKYYFTFLVEDNSTHYSDPPTVAGTFSVLAQQTNRQVVNG